MANLFVHPDLRRSTKHDTHTFVVGSGSSSGSVNIQFGGSWELVVNDVFYVGDIETTSGDI
jgi:hypothetical protein